MTILPLVPKASPEVWQPPHDRCSMRSRVSERDNNVALFPEQQVVGRRRYGFQDDRKTLNLN